MKTETLLKTAAILGLTAVIFGAMGAHALEAKISPDSLESFKTGVRYQMWHALALLAVAAIPLKFKYLKGLFWCWLLGVLLFSGSIYLLATREITGLEVGFLGPVTPVGGLMLIIGWVLLAFFAKGPAQENAE